MINEALKQSYITSSYPQYVHEGTHPSEIAAVASLYGFRPVKPANARILEIGCGTGHNLVAIASDLPGADLLGLDLAPNQIETADAAAQKAGLKNTHFVCADLLDYDLADQQFDFIILHGVFSWVPNEVKQRILEVCNKHLAKDGLAYISYNVLPGWSYKRDLCQLLRESAAGATGPAEALAGVDKTLNFLYRVIKQAAQPLPLHIQTMAHEIDIIARKDPGAVLHDELEQVNDPFYFSGFLKWCADAGLTYVSDANLKDGWSSVWPTALLKVLGDHPVSRIQAEQFYDFFVYRRFRRSLLCRGDHKLESFLDTNAVRPLSITLTSEAKKPVDNPDERQFTFTLPNGQQVAVNHEISQAVIDCIGSAPTPITVQDAFDWMMEHRSELMSEEGMESGFNTFILLLATRDMVRLVFR